MKKILATLGILTCLCGVVGLTACGGDAPKDPPAQTTPGGDTAQNPPAQTTPGGDTAQDKEITGVTFSNAEYVYDGTEKTLTATGLPDGVSAAYTNNKGTNAGTYSASVVLSGEGYITKTLTATLTITPKTMAGITLAQDSEIDYDGQKHFPELSGTLPTGATKVWKFNNVVLDGVRDPDEYEVELTISAPNYNDLVLTASYTIKPDYAKIAQDVMSVFDVKPDPWSFLPESFAIENKVIAAAEVPTATTYESFVAVEDIPTNYVGQQMDVVYDVLKTCDVALGYVTKVNGALNAIQQAYQIFLNSSPVNQGAFSKTVEIGGVQCAFTILLDGDYYTLTVNVSGVEVYLYGDIEEECYGARVQITADTLLKYELADGKLVIALNVLDNYSTYVEFSKEGTDTLGYVYQYMGALGLSTTKSALLRVDENYTTVVGTMGDFVLSADGRNCEVYKNSTGELVGTEVSEILLEGKTAFDTLWYNLKDVQGITSIKKVDEMNLPNPDTIYINGNSILNGKPNTIHTELVIGITWKVGSRKFDIEFKEVCAYTYDEGTGKYTQVKFEVPMVFIQEEYEEDFNKDFKDANKTDEGDKITVNLSVLEEDRQAIDAGYYTLVNAYNEIAELVTPQMIADFCAKKSS